MQTNAAANIRSCQVLCSAAPDRKPEGPSVPMLEHGATLWSFTTACLAEVGGMLDCCNRGHLPSGLMWGCVGPLE